MTVTAVQDVITLIAVKLIATVAAVQNIVAASGVDFRAGTVALQRLRLIGSRHQHRLHRRHVPDGAVGKNNLLNPMTVSLVGKIALQAETVGTVLEINQQVFAAALQERVFCQ